MQYEFLSQINTWNLAQQQILVRADLNTPHDDEKITDSFRLEAIIPTLELILSKGGFAHLITHLDSPHIADKKNSIALIAAWFSRAGYKPPFVHIHENLRFSPLEKESSFDFARMLSRGMKFYIDDAFGSLHRNDTSLTVLPRCFPLDHRSIGLLVERELSTLLSVKNNPQRPYIFLLGGGKIKDKLVDIMYLLDYADHIMLCPGLSSLFIPQLESRYDDTLISLRNKITRKARHNQLLLPHDYLVGDDHFQPPYQYKAVSNITTHQLPIAIGPQTVHAWKQYINAAQTIVCNGPMGFHCDPATQETLALFLKEIALSSAYTIAGGGDMMQALKTFRLQGLFKFCSTGGGSMLSLLAHLKLPALEALSEDQI